MAKTLKTVVLSFNLILQQLHKSKYSKADKKLTAQTFL